MNFTNKRVTVIGLSGSGFSAAKLLRRLKAKVRISEAGSGEDIKSRLRMLEGIESEIGGHTRNFISGSDIIVISPGVALASEPVKWANDANIPVIGELELGAMFCRAPIIAVTGTNGKSTTVTLIDEILKANGVNSFLLGNIGRPICEDALDIPVDSAVSLEVSSFQLEAIKTFRPKVAVYLNLTQDHLDRYADMDEYGTAKLRIFENQAKGDYAVLNYDDRNVRAAAEKINSRVYYFSRRKKVKGAYLSAKRLMLDIGDGPQEIAKRDEINLIGDHNIENVLAASLAVRLINRKAEFAATLHNFIGLSHRFELVAEIGGVKYIDDSKSTTVDSTLRAIESQEGNVILIAGGRDKGSDYSLIIPQLSKVKCLILIGEARDKIKGDLDRLNIPIKDAGTMDEAVSISMDVSGEGDTVLLSPMCASFDMFKNYKERGDAFRNAVFDGLCNSYARQPAQ